MKRFVLQLFFILLSASASCASILVFSQDGTYTTKTTLSEASTAADVAGKTVVVTSALSAAQSNVATWPSDRTLKIIKGGSLSNTVDITINGPFQAGLDHVFVGSGQILFGSNSIREISLEWFGGIGDNSTDNTPALHKARDCANTSAKRFDIVVSPGTYYLNSTVNLVNYRDITIRGSSASDENNSVQFIGLTGSTPMFDMCGAHGSSLRNIFLLSQYAQAGHSTIGILHGFTSTDGMHCYWENVQIWLPNEPTANNGLGTVGFISKSGEESTMVRCQIKANLPVLLTTQASTSWLTGSTFTITSQFATLSNNSNLAWTFVESNHFLALNKNRPAIALQQSGSIDLGNTYIGSVNNAGEGATGSYVASIAIGPLGAEGVQYHGTQETFDTILDLQGSLKRSKISANFGSVGTIATGIQWTDGAELHNCDINLNYSNVAATPINRIIFDVIEDVSHLTPLSGSITATKIKITGNQHNNTGAIPAKLARLAVDLEVETDTNYYTYKNNYVRPVYWYGTVPASGPLTMSYGCMVLWSSLEPSGYKGTALSVEFDGFLRVAAANGGNLQSMDKFKFNFGVVRDGTGTIIVGTPTVTHDFVIDVDAAQLHAVMSAVQVTSDANGFYINIEGNPTGAQRSGQFMDVMGTIKIAGSAGKSYGVTIVSAN